MQAIPKVPTNNRRSLKPKSPKRTTERFTNAFLSYQFSPMVGTAGINEWAKEGFDIEADFSQSVCNLANLYQFDAHQLLQKKTSYPLWITDTYAKIEKLLKKADPTAVLVLVENNGRAELMTYKQHVPPYGLYYIPVKIYSDLVASGDHRAGLVGAIFYYMLREAHVPYITEGWDDFISLEYQSLKDSYEIRMEEQEDDEEMPTSVLELDGIQTQAEICLLRFDKHSQLTTLARRIDRYRQLPDFDEDLASIADSVLQLHQQYPDRCIHQAAFPELVTEDEEIDETELLKITTYLSFIWQEDDWAGQQISQTIDHYYQNGAEPDYPKSVMSFRRPHLTNTLDLSYETKLFATVSRLILYLYSTEETDSIAELPKQ